MAVVYNWKNEYYRYRRYFFNIRQTVASPQFRSFTWLSITVFTVSFFLIVAIRPTLVTIAKLQREIKDKETASIQLQQKIDSIIKAQAEMVENLDQIEKLNQMLPEEIDYDRTASVVEELAILNNVSISSLSFKNLGESYQIKGGAGSGSFLTIPYQIVVSGNYNDLKNFMRAMENSRRLPLIFKSSYSVTISEVDRKLSLSLIGSFLYQGKLADNTKQ